MPIDPRIAMGVQPLQLPMQNPNNQMNVLAQALQVKNGMSQMQAAEQERAERNALNEAYRGALGSNGEVDRNLLTRTLADRNLGARIPSLQKQWADVDKAKADVGKTQADTEKARLEVANKRVDTWGRTMGFVRQNPTIENATAAVQHLVAMQVIPQEQAQAALAQVQSNPTPQAIAQFADLGFRAALEAKEQLMKMQTNNIGGQTVTQGIDPVTGKASLVSAVQNTQSPDNAASNARMAADAAASRAVQIRGQNLADARAKEATSATMSKPFEVTGPDGQPVLVQQDKQGNIKPVQGYAPKSGGKPMTEGQAKANLFGSRMKESDRILSELEGKYSPLAVNSKMGAEKLPGMIGGAMGAIGNLTLPKEAQMAEQAQRDFVNAVLRRESGAVISDPEFANAQKQYFPQPGDGKEVLAQKRRNRQMAIQGLEAEVPGGLRSGGAAPAAGGGWGIKKVE